MNMRQNYRMSHFIISRFNTYMFYQIKRTALLEFIPFIDVSISIGTVEHKADINIKSYYLVAILRKRLFRKKKKGVQLRDRALTTPLGVVVPGSRSIECIWGV